MDHSQRFQTPDNYIFFSGKDGGDIEDPPTTYYKLYSSMLSDFQKTKNKRQPSL